MPTDDAAFIPPQQAFDQLSRLRLQDHSMHSALQEVSDLTKVTVPGASEVSVSLVTNGRADTAVSTGQLAVDLDESQYERGYGPCLDAAWHGQIMHIEDMTTETRWADYTAVAAEQGAFSSLSVPISVQETPAVSVALNIYSTHRHAFDDASIRTAITLAGYAESALINMQVHDNARQLVRQLSAALETRPVIDQAKGILMRDRACTAEEAFDLLVAASQRTNRKLRLIAEDVVNSVTTQPSPAQKASNGR
jgi:GAF domain-containing protein